ncbi:MAG TPA: M15 family metallopeptidase [Actinomadura sp.]|nr:M15 family metallopeptidase [Actinomadura sp.]
MITFKDPAYRGRTQGRARAFVRRGLTAVLGAGMALAMTPAPAATAHTTPGLPPGFVVLHDVAPTILHDIRYRTFHNFVGRPVDGYEEPLCILTREAAVALGRAQRRLLEQGYTLKVYDCYRPQRAVDHFARWARDTGDQRMKREFYPNVDKTTLFDQGYIAARSGHSRGSTVDLTLVRLPAGPQRHYIPGEPLVPCFAPAGLRFPDNTVDMGTGFDCFDTLANTMDPRITGRARANRLRLKASLEAAGFGNYAAEWWHYTLKGEPYPDTYFDFPVARNPRR